MYMYALVSVTFGHSRRSRRRYCHCMVDTCVRFHHAEHRILFHRDSVALVVIYWRQFHVLRPISTCVVLKIIQWSRWPSKIFVKWNSIKVGHKRVIWTRSNRSKWLFPIKKHVVHVSLWRPTIVRPTFLRFSQRAISKGCKWVDDLNNTIIVLFRYCIAQ